MKITPSLAGRYRPRVLATYPLLSARLTFGGEDGFVAAPMTVRGQGRILRVQPLIGLRISARGFSSALSSRDGLIQGSLFLSSGVGRLLLSDGISTLEVRILNLVFSVNKGAVDTVAFSDSLVFSISTVRSSTMVGGDSFSSAGAGVLSLTSNGAAADSGLIFSQGYTDTLDYFAQDYVGTSSSF